MGKEVREMSKKPGGSGGLVWPCAACKLLRRRCAQDCIFAPYFPANEPQKFANVHKVFGASNVNKLLQIFSHFTLCSFACLVLTVQANSKALRKGDIGDMMENIQNASTRNKLYHG